MDTNGYWNRLSSSRLSRRRAIALTGGASLGAALLAACGGSDGKSNGGAGGTPVDNSSLVTKPSERSGAVSGGTWSQAVTADPLVLDPISAAAAPSYAAGIMTYSRLVKYKASKYPEKPVSLVEGDAAQSFEVSPDGLQITFKLRPNMKFDPRPPTSGRALSASDVIFTWNKFSNVSPNRRDLVNAQNPQAPITGMTAPDDQTVVVKLAFPMAPILPMMAFSRYIQIQPKEADGGFDPKGDMRGSGPWRLDKYEPSIAARFKRNSDYYVNRQPYLDGIDRVVLPEYATGLASFKAGNLWTFDVRQEDVLQTKSDKPALSLFQNNQFSRTVNLIFFGAKTNSPFKDMRVRQAASMLIDRDLWIETVFNTQKFKQAGLPVESRWHTHLPAGEELYWEDPKGKDFGEASKYFKYDPAGAKALMKAAGFNSALEVPFTPSPQSPEAGRVAEILRGMLEAGGDFKLPVNQVDYRTVWQPQYIFGKGQFDGITTSVTATYPDIDGLLTADYANDGAYNVMTFSDDKSQSLIMQQRRELDPKKRIQLIKELGRYLGQNMFDVPFPGDALGFTLGWPWLANYLVNQTVSPDAAGGEVWSTYWYDKTKQS